MALNLSHAKLADCLLAELDAQTQMQATETTRRERFAANVRQLLDRYRAGGQSKTDLCRSIGTNPTTLDRWASEGIERDTGNLAKSFAEYFEVSLESLWQDHLQPAPSPTTQSKTQAVHSLPDPLLAMAQRALNGPQRKFLTEAIKMCYAAAITSQPDD